jgi:hypothetical protein
MASGGETELQQTTPEPWARCRSFTAWFRPLSVASRLVECAFDARTAGSWQVAGVSSFAGEPAVRRDRPQDQPAAGGGGRRGRVGPARGRSRRTLGPPDPGHRAQGDSTLQGVREGECVVSAAGPGGTAASHQRNVLRTGWHQPVNIERHRLRVIPVIRIAAGWQSLAVSPRQGPFR